MSDGPGLRYCLPKKHEKKQREGKRGNRAYFAPPIQTSQVRNLVMAVLTLGLMFDALLRTPQQINACAGRAGLFRGYSNSFKVPVWRLYGHVSYALATSHKGTWGHTENCTSTGSRETTMWQHLEPSRSSCVYFNARKRIFPPEWEWPDRGAFPRPFPGGF
jgi:hypothetical protein